MYLSQLSPERHLYIPCIKFKANSEMSTYNYSIIWHPMYVIIVMTDGSPVNYIPGGYQNVGHQITSCRQHTAQTQLQHEVSVPSIYA